MFNIFKRNFQTFLEEFGLQLLLITLMVLIVFYPFILNIKPFILGTDQQLTYNIFYEEWFRLIKNFLHTGELPFYSWNKFLGSDFYASSSIYVTGDFLIPILIFFKSIEKAMLFETIVLIYISSITFHIYLKDFDIKDRKVIIFVSILYAISGLAILYYGSYMFHRFYSMLPLLFAGVERYLKYNKKILFIFSVFILFVTSFYFLFPTSLYLGFYFIFRYFMTSKKISVSNFLKSSFILIFFYLIGFLLSAFISLPAILYIFNNPRIGVTYDSNLFFNSKVILAFIFSHLAAPYPIYTNIPYMFYSGATGHESWFSVFTSFLTPVIILNYLLFIKDKDKKYFLIFLIFNYLILFIRPINSIFHGFSEPTFRFIFLYIIFILLFLAYILDNYINASILKGSIVSLIIILISFFVSYLCKYLDYSIYFQHINFLVFIIVLNFIILVIFKFKLKHFLFIIILGEVIITNAFIIKTYNEDFYYYTPSVHQEYVEYYQSIDEDIFYRMYINPKHLYPTSTMNLNQSMSLNFKSVMSYDSAYEPNLRPFLQLNGINWHIINLENPNVLRMLGVKYFAVYEESELPDGYHFEYVYDLDFLHVYKLLEYRSIGFTYTNFALESSIENVWVDWNNRAIIKDQDLDLIKDIQLSDSVNLKVTEYTNDTLSGTIELKQKQLLFLSIPYNEGWSITDNGQKIDYININGGFIGIPLNEGIHNIEMKFKTIGFDQGIVLTLIGVIIYITLIIKEKLNH